MLIVYRQSNVIQHKLVTKALLDMRQKHECNHWGGRGSRPPKFERTPSFYVAF